MQSVFANYDIFNIIISDLRFEDMERLINANISGVSEVVIPIFHIYYQFLDDIHKYFSVNNDTDRVYNRYFEIHGDLPKDLWFRLGNHLFNYMMLARIDQPNYFVDIELYIDMIRISSKYTNRKLSSDFAELVAKENHYGICVNYIALRNNPAVLDLCKNTVFVKSYVDMMANNITEFKQFAPPIDYYLIEFDVKGTFGSNIYYREEGYHANPFALWIYEDVFPEFLIETIRIAAKEVTKDLREIPVVLRMMGIYDAEPPPDLIKNSYIRERLIEDNIHIYSNLCGPNPGFVAF